MPRIVAHRGASAAFPENTLEAFEGAADLGAAEVELDVRPSADGALVVHHDAHLVDGTPVSETFAADLPSHVCLLGDALEVCDRRSLGVNVEIKALPGEPGHDRAPQTAEQVARLLAERYGESPRVLVTSFWPPTLAQVRSSAPGLRTGLLCFELSDFESLLEQTTAGGHVAINPWDGMLTAQMVGLARRAGLELNAWTVDDPGRMAELAEWGVDGVITNVPDVALRVFSP